MIQYNSLNVKLSNSQLNKLKSVIKNGTDVNIRLSSNMIGNLDDETNFPHKLLLTNKQVANLRKAFGNYTSIDIKLSKAQLTKMYHWVLYKLYINYTIGYTWANCCCISYRSCNKQKNPRVWKSFNINNF